MIIGIDGNEANVKEKVGVSIYTLKLLEFFQNVSSQNQQFTVFLKNKPLFDLPAENTFYRYAVVRGDFLWSQTFLPLELYKRKAFGQPIKIFFSPAHYSPRLCPVPVIVTVHDLSYFHYPNEFLKKDLYQLKNWTRYSVEKAKKVIAVSNTTKKDIIKFYHIPEEKIAVIYNGYEKEIHPRGKAKEQSKLHLGGVKQRYILYVGTLQPRKNVTTLIHAFAKFRKLYPEFKLIIAGKKGWLYENIFKTVHDLEIENYVEFKGYVDENELTTLYKNAFCFVMPSLYEGFGLPLLEAMSFGCPVVSSFSSSLPEVGGDACLYFDPKSADDLVDKLIELKENKNLSRELKHKGKKRTRLFSWQKCAEETLKVISSSTDI